MQLRFKQCIYLISDLRVAYYKNTKSNQWESCVVITGLVKPKVDIILSMHHLCCNKTPIKDVGSMLDLKTINCTIFCTQCCLLKIYNLTCLLKIYNLTTHLLIRLVFTNTHLTVSEIRWLPKVHTVCPSVRELKILCFFFLFLNLTQARRIVSDETVTWVSRSKFHKMHALVCFWIHDMCPKYLISNSKPTRSIVLQVYDRVLSFRITPHIIFFLTLRQLSRV